MVKHDGEAHRAKLQALCDAVRSARQRGLMGHLPGKWTFEASGHSRKLRTEGWQGRVVERVNKLLSKED